MFSCEKEIQRINMFGTCTSNVTECGKFRYVLITKHGYKDAVDEPSIAYLYFTALSTITGTTTSKSMVCMHTSKSSIACNISTSAAIYMDTLVEWASSALLVCLETSFRSFKCSTFNLADIYTPWSSYSRNCLSLSPQHFFYDVAQHNSTSPDTLRRMG